MHLICTVTSIFVVGFLRFFLLCFRFKNLAFRPLTAETRAHIPRSERLWLSSSFQRTKFCPLSESWKGKQLLDHYRSWPSTLKGPGLQVPPGPPHSGVFTSKPSEPTTTWKVGTMASTGVPKGRVSCPCICWSCCYTRRADSHLCRSD